MLYELGCSSKEQLQSVILLSVLNSISLSQIVILICGCAEVLMGFVLTQEEDHTSLLHVVYIPFWQGALVHNI